MTPTQSAKDPGQITLERPQINYKIERLRLVQLSRNAIMEINALRAAISDKPQAITMRHVIWVLTRGTTIIFVAREKSTRKIVGMSTLIISAQLNPGKGWLEDLAVFPEFGGQGIGKVLAAAVVMCAKRHRITKLDLTSRNDRAAAHGMYNAFGWKTRDGWLARLDSTKFDPADVLTPDQVSKLA